MDQSIPWHLTLIAAEECYQLHLTRIPSLTYLSNSSQTLNSPLTSFQVPTLQILPLHLKPQLWFCSVSLKDRKNARRSTVRNFGALFTATAKGHHRIGFRESNLMTEWAIQKIKRGFFICFVSLWFLEPLMTVSRASGLYKRSGF